ncbi:hypothetical protein [Streptomyces shenzhenensis]|uniref:hypothetical protein n=1 Tax=Streptomyces shenzhenensis TaxID=943815 RepID=UPI001F40D461|nr:hypothetical protein [Streptomyces shenzhenensis]
MNGWGFAAVAVVCVTALLIALLRAAVRIGPQAQRGPAPATSEERHRVELSADEEFAAVLEHNRAGRAALGRQIAEAAERAERERRGEW